VTLGVCAHGLLIVLVFTRWRSKCIGQCCPSVWNEVSESSRYIKELVQRRWEEPILLYLDRFAHPTLSSEQVPIYMRLLRLSLQLALRTNIREDYLGFKVGLIANLHLFCHEVPDDVGCNDKLYLSRCKGACRGPYGPKTLVETSGEYKLRHGGQCLETWPL
jgi:hypothetical protein